MARIVAHSYPEWWLRLTGQVAHWSTDYSKEFTEWSKTARKKRKLCEDGQISLEEFQAWLDESKCKQS